MTGRCRRRVLRALLALGLVGAGVVTPVDGGETAQAQEGSYDLELAAALRDAGLLDEWYATALVEPELTFAVVLTPDGTPSRTAFLEAIGRQRATRDQLAQIEATLVAQREALSAIMTEIPLRAAERDDAEMRRSEVRDERATTVAQREIVVDLIENAAVEQYIGGGGADVSLLWDIEAFNDAATVQHLLELGVDDLMLARHALIVRIDRQDRSIDNLTATITELDAVLDQLAADQARTEGEIALAEAARDTHQATLASLDAELPSYLPRIHAERATGLFVPAGLPLSVVNAYVHGARIGRESRPGCDIPWPVLAGIGAVESHHGTYLGATVGPDGTVSPPILGPLLDGTLAGNAVIVDTDGGALDGNAEFDRAMGPMQFIPATWAAFALDASDDGFADPQNLADATATAGNYLCAITPMSNDAEIRRGIFGYNHSDAYVAAVLAQAEPFFKLRLEAPPAEFGPPPSTLALTDDPD